MVCGEIEQRCKCNALSQDLHQDDNELTSIPILCLHFPQQMPTNFKISPLPNEINSWLIYGRNTWCQISRMGQMGRVLSINWMPRHLHGQPQQARANPLARSICHGCQEQKIFRLTFQHIGWRHRQRYHLKCGADLLVIGKTEFHKRADNKISILLSRQFWAFRNEDLILMRSNKRPFHLQSLMS